MDKSSGKLFIQWENAIISYSHLYRIVFILNPDLSNKIDLGDSSCILINSGERDILLSFLGLVGNLNR